VIRALFGLLALLLAAPALADSGRFVEIAAVPSVNITPPHVVVWLPPGYDAGKGRYPVVYMHDGQNIFFPERSNFNKVWAADKSALRLIAAHRVKPFIIVAIDQPGADRYRQYFPQAIDAAAPPALRKIFAAGGPVFGDRYLNFLVTELKPKIDREYRTLADPRHTAIVGSSMGGLISCYAFGEYPRVFGRAGCVSTHWLLMDPNLLPAGADPIAMWEAYFDRKLGKPAGRRLWMDHGTETLDAYYDPWQRRIDAKLVQLGWRKGRDFESRVYPGAAHEENAWAARLDDIFAWLLK
jgi:predicted alpha/beta superfamily hydrolase